MPLFTYLKPLQEEVIQLPNDCWICHDAGDPVILSITNFSLISSASVSLQHTQISLTCQTPSPCRYISLPLITIPSPGNLASRLYTKKGTQGKGDQNKTRFSLQNLQFYGPLWPSPFQFQATDSNGNYQEAFMIQN